MLDKFNLMSVNQLAAEIKLLEVWKSLNVEGCPLKLEPYNAKPEGNNHVLRSQPNIIFCDTARLQMSNSSLNIDAARLWNVAPTLVRNALTIVEAKRVIKNHCKTLPVWTLNLRQKSLKCILQAFMHLFNILNMQLAFWRDTLINNTWGPNETFQMHMNTLQFYENYIDCNYL